MPNNSYDRDYDRKNERDRDYDRNRDYDRDRDYDGKKERERSRDKDYDLDYDRDRDYNRDRGRDRDRNRDYERDYDRADMDDRQIREEIDRLRREVNSLKEALENRRAENSDLKMAIRQAEKNSVDLLNVINTTLVDISSRMDKLDGGGNLKEELEEINMPIEAKCVAIEEKIKSLQEFLDYSGPMKEQVESLTEGMKETLAEKFGSKTIGDVLQKLATISTFLIADSIGIVVLLALMCFFTISLMK